MKDVAGESVLLVRTRDGRPAGHYNVCRHRGSQLVPEGGTGCFAGRIRVFRSGFYAPMESWSLDIRRYIGERLGAGTDGGTL